MQPDGFRILYEAGPCLVVSKPSGLLTQAPPHIDSLEARIKRFIKVRDQKPGNVYLGVPHRLDRPVSGALVVACHARAARRIAEQFERRTVLKTYWALVEGRVSTLEDTWRDYLRKVPGEARAEVVDATHADAKKAVLHYRVLGEDNGRTWLELNLETGRTHQIRIQAASRGLPIVGDQQYGAQQPFGPPSEEPRDRWIALHARRLALRHPMTREAVDVTAPLPAGWPAWAQEDA